MKSIQKTKETSPVENLMEDIWDTDATVKNRFLSNLFWPALNVKETKNHFTIELAAPGFKKDDFKIGLNEQCISVSAGHVTSKKQGKAQFRRREFTATAFNRCFSLPDNVRRKGVQANYKNGLLTIIIDKSKKKHLKKSLLISANKEILFTNGQL